MAASPNQPASGTARILLVDDDPGLLRLLTIRLRAEGYEVEAVDSAAAALSALSRFAADLVITDLRMEKMDGLALLRQLRRQRPGLAVLLLTAHGTIPDAVEAMQSGAFGFLTKPVDREDLLAQVTRALTLSGASLAVGGGAATPLVTRNPAMRELLTQVTRIADADTPVLLSGPSGTGKTLLAQLIHEAGCRRNAPFLTINCSAMPEVLLDAELFGHAAGGIPDRDETQPGRFREAAGGTLLLDEIGDMPQRTQVKLLRVLEERRVHPVGATQAEPVDVRLISATHHDVQQLLMSGRLREDLYYRLSAVHLRVPPLDARREDIPLLADHFLCNIAEAAPDRRRVFAPEALEMLVAADWPGHVRQLENTVHQCVATSSAPVITGEQLRAVLGTSIGTGLPSFAEARDEFTRNYLSTLLTMTGGNVSQAARLARRNRTDFYKLLNRHDLNPDQFKSA